MLYFKNILLVMKFNTLYYCVMFVSFKFLIQIFAVNPFIDFYSVLCLQS